MSSQYVVHLSEPAEMTYCELAGAGVSAEAFQEIDDLLESKLAVDPTSEKNRLAGKLSWLYRVTVGGHAICYLPLAQSRRIIVISIFKILDGCPSGEQVWTRLMASGEHIATLRALGLQRYQEMLTPVPSKMLQ
jgi:hypothetical protein